MAPLLAIPPFPGARAPAFAVPGGAGNDDPELLLAALAQHRVGGCYWGRQLAGPTVLDTANWPADADPWSLLTVTRAAAWAGAGTDSATVHRASRKPASTRAGPVGRHREAVSEAVSGLG